MKPNTLLLAMCLVASCFTAVLATQILIKPEGEPVAIEVMPIPSRDGSFIIEGDWASILAQPKAPLYVVEKYYLHGADENNMHLLAKRIIALMHNEQHVQEVKEKARQDPNLILATLHPARIRELRAAFPDRQIIEVMPDPEDTRRRAGNKTYILNQP